MGQGNAIAHLMPPPFYAYRYVVAKARAPEESIQDMIDVCSPVADVDHRYKIEVMPGVYAEEITMAPYVDVVAPYGRAVIRPPVSVSTAVTMDSNGMLQGLQVDMQSMAATAIGVDFGAKINCSIEDVWVTGGGAADIGVLDASTGTTVIIRDCRIDGAATGYKKTAAGTTWFADNRVTSSDIDIDMDAGTLNLLDNELMWTGVNVDVAGTSTIDSYNNTLNGTGWSLADSANISILSHDDVFSKVTFAGANGVFADLAGAKLYDCVADALAIGDWVYCDSDDHVALTDADDITMLPCIGRVAYLPTTSTCYVTNYGYAYDAAANSGHGDAWVAGKEFWVSGAPGEITTTMPAVFPQMVGVAVSTQRFKIDIGDVLGWVHTNEYLNASGVVSVDDWVYITATNDTVGLAKADAAVTMSAIGVVVEVIDLTHCRVKMRGKWAESNTDEGWVASDDLYISPDTAGAITRVEPVMDIVQKVAEVRSFDTPALIYEIAD